MKKKLLIVPALLIAALGTTNAQTTIFSEDFQGTSGVAIPATWSQSTLATDGGWKSGTALSSTSFVIPAHTRYLATNDDGCNCDKSNDFLKSTSFSLVGSSFPQLTFDVLFYHGTYGGYTEVGTIEVSTNSGVSWTVLQTLTGSGSWVSGAANLTAYAGMANVMVGFRYNDGGGTAAWTWGMALDNVMVIEPVMAEVSVTNVIMDKYSLNGSLPVSTVFQSFGGPMVTTATLKYSVDGGAPVSQTFSPNIGYGGTYTANFTTTAAMTSGFHKVKSWITDINGGGADANPVNDSALWKITTMATQPIKNVIVEEFTGSWCGYCPRGGVTLSQITAADPKIIGIAVHGGGTNEKMQTTEGNTFTTAYNQGFPTGCVDRSWITTATTPDYAVSDGDWGAAAAAREGDVVPATVALSAVSFNSATRVVTATVTATFVGDVQGAFSLNCILTENWVFGPYGTTADNGWNQHSYYFGTSGSPFQGVGLTSSPWSTGTAGLMPHDYQHNHVAVKYIGGAYGDNTVIPATLVTTGTTFTKTFTYTLPAANPLGAHAFNADNIYVIGVVSEYDATNSANRYTLNSVEQKLNSNAETNGVAEMSSAQFGTLAVYPNPATSETNVSLELNATTNVSINVFNGLGELVYSANNYDLNAGTHILNINTENFANGIYNIVVNTSNGSVTKKVTISK